MNNLLKLSILFIALTPIEVFALCKKIGDLGEVAYQEHCVDGEHVEIVKTRGLSFDRDPKQVLNSQKPHRKAQVYIPDTKQRKVRSIVSNSSSNDTRSRGNGTYSPWYRR